MASEKFPEFRVPQNLVKRCYTEGKALSDYRTEFMRDRDRLMYATAFRRLAGKTQIFTVGSDDHKKNRLTHTLEVAQIARTIAVALGLDSDLAEAIALGHDFGHTPFGHAGERMLNEIMIPESKYVKHSPFYHCNAPSLMERFEREDGNKKGYMKNAFGFKHNLQSVRVAAVLEDSYRGEDGQNIGLNLTNYTLYGMMMHSKINYDKADKYPNFQDEFREQMLISDGNLPAWSFEAYIVKWADDIAQWHHDLEDAMREGVLPVKTICKTIKESLEGKMSKFDKDVLKKVSTISSMDRSIIAELSHIVVNTLVDDIVCTARKNLKKLKKEIKKAGANASDIFSTEYDRLGLSVKRENVVVLSNRIKNSIFESTIKEAIHHSRNVERMNEKGKYIIRKLFEAYYTHPQQLPDGPILHLLVEVNPDKYKNIDEVRKIGIGQARVDFEEIMKNPNIYVECKLMRRICDHIASMTDHYAIEEYNNLYG